MPCTVLNFGEVYNGAGQETTDLIRVSQKAFDSCDVDLIKAGEKVTDDIFSNTYYEFGPEAKAGDYYFTTSFTTKVTNSAQQQVDVPNCKLGQRIKVTLERGDDQSSQWGLQIPATMNTRIGGSCTDREDLYLVSNSGLGVNILVRATFPPPLSSAYNRL